MTPPVRTIPPLSGWPGWPRIMIPTVTGPATIRTVSDSGAAPGVQRVVLPLLLRVPTLAVGKRRPEIVAPWTMVVGRSPSRPVQLVQHRGSAFYGTIHCIRILFCGKIIRSTRFKKEMTANISIPTNDIHTTSVNMTWSFLHIFLSVSVSICLSLSATMGLTKEKEKKKASLFFSSVATISDPIPPPHLVESFIE
jgi:hypothetical protein